LAHLLQAQSDGGPDGLLKVLTRPLGESRHRARKTMPLQELAWSVGCERRLDWRPPAPPAAEGQASVDHELSRKLASDQTFTRLNNLERAVVQAACQALAKSDGDELADRAWAAAYTTYWSTGSQRRWSGNARVSTLIVGVAKNLWLSDRARRAPTGMDFDADIPAPRGQDSDLSGLTESIRRDVQDVATARQREILGLLVERGLSQQQAARVLGVSEAAISQTLSRLAERLEPLGYGARTGRRGGK
jgi:DNA-directed RNA polymerase specialized sigma24 family protein